ncbi:LPXTG-motif cell wall anchor domain-containing protein [Corynebacterium glutamicum MT]|uniref:Cell wall protein n=1 Tax=Corynebacterium glutamicum TaxID=1718 RepID=A0AB36IAL7_CORGT|nr:HtaA domain-containing protein [Corynebacterium glutamicum]AGN17754.1 LPXTG-motif cell wall anchor domain-containing protein [Corynebacterium glutamicum SCgG1]AGN20777.1 LPXTG-motif cell wall anchor domain-containing protein [Corynebacterium glutamicum SCgG2]EGV39946.1 LPXTG-motif cell wall anchor domain protein [Corynebacterium glutamicum S9114]EOA65993.1 LPXTG-motif cell wall anchor domain-containing protein [Corynebacterium glutamicum MT]EPP42060.1 LPXTG-motif cell wall anchor domain-con
MHTLEWGVKESFRAYFERLPDHNYALSGGSKRLIDGQFQFPGSSVGTRRLEFYGEVRMTGHHGALSLQIADPIIEFQDADSALLSAVVDEENAQPYRLVIATLKKKLEDARSIIFDTQLADDGQFLFMGNYFAGDPMDLITIRK